MNLLNKLEHLIAETYSRVLFIPGRTIVIPEGTVDLQPLSPLCALRHAYSTYRFTINCHLIYQTSDSNIMRAGIRILFHGMILFLEEFSCQLQFESRSKWISRYR